MVNGIYSVLYNGFHGGCGQVVLNNGIIDGSDAGYKWIGNYKIDGMRLYGSILASPESPVINIFGDGDVLDLEIIGEIAEGSIKILGTRKNRPEHRLSAELRPIKL